MQTQTNTIRPLALFSLVVSPLMLIYGLSGLSSLGTANPLGSVAGLLFQLGAMSTAIALYRTRATGDGAIGKGIVLFQALLHGLAALFQIFEYYQLEPQLGPIYTITDIAWPLGFLFWLVTGSAVVRAGRWTGSTRFLPLCCPLPLVLTIGLGGVLGGMLGEQGVNLLFTGGLSLVFFLLALTLWRQSNEPSQAAILQPTF